MEFRSTTADTPDDLRNLSYRELDHLFEVGEIIKEGGKQDVRLCQVKNQKLVVKSYKYSGLLSAFRIFIRLSRPHKSLRYACYLRSHNVPCPGHFLVLARWGLWSARAYLLIEYVEGPRLHDFLYPESSRMLSEETAQAAIDTIKLFHSLGLAHGDLHTQNIILKNETTVQLIDLDNVRKARHRQSKDLARFLASVENGKQNREILLGKIKEQLE